MNKVNLDILLEQNINAIKAFKAIGKNRQLISSIDLTMNRFKLTQKTVLALAGINSKEIGVIRKEYTEVLRRRNPNSYLKDRVHYARCVFEGSITLKEASELSGYEVNSIRTWVKAYSIYGDDIVSRACSFRKGTL